MLSEAGERENKLRSKLGTYEAQEQDLLHDVELSNFSRSEQKAFASKMRDLRIKRREVKDELEVVEVIARIAKNANGKVITDLTQLFTKVNQVLDSHKNRYYKPKARTDLKLVKTQKMNVRMSEDQTKVKIL